MVRHLQQMSPRTIRGRAALIGAALVLAVAVAACGSSSNGGSAGAQTLLNQTFSGKHAVKSGNLNLSLTISPTGSSTFTSPISLSLGGPFQSRGAGQLPESSLTLNIDALGHHGQLGVISTGSAGYVTLSGTAYQLPAADFQKLASSFGAGAGQSGGLAKLGIKPLHWLSSPSIVGSDSVGGTPTTHIRAHVNVGALLSDFGTLLQKAANSGATGTASLPSTLSAASRQKIASEIQHPTVDIWTGASDHTLRKLAINLSLPVSGTASSELGGMSSAAMDFTLQYTGLNQSQTISAPTNVQPFSGFEAKIKSIFSGLSSTLGSSALGGSSGAGSGSSSSSSGATGSSSNVQKYSQCIQNAASDVKKMQKCAALLSG